MNEHGSYVPFAAYEAAEERADRRDRRHWIGHIIELAIIVLMAALFLWYLNQYDFTAETVQQDGEGVNIIGDRNGVDYFGTEDYLQEAD